MKYNFEPLHEFLTTVTPPKALAVIMDEIITNYNWMIIKTQQNEEITGLPEPGIESHLFNLREFRNTLQKCKKIKSHGKE